MFLSEERFQINEFLLYHSHCTNFSDLIVQNMFLKHRILKLIDLKCSYILLYIYIFISFILYSISYNDKYDIKFATQVSLYYCWIIEYSLNH